MSPAYLEQNPDPPASHFPSAEIESVLPGLVYTVLYDIRDETRASGIGASMLPSGLHPFYQNFLANEAIKTFPGGVKEKELY